MGGRLLERAEELAVLVGAVAEAAGGRGSIVSVTGEAGIGKTSLVRAFAEQLPTVSRLLLTGCDDLMAPRTLGPLRDVARGTSGPLAAALSEGVPSDRVFPALLEELTLRSPTVLVVEDVHWADDATLDLLLYVARRVETLAVLLVLTYRDASAGARGPLSRLLGALAGCPVHRLPLPPLSRAAVTTLVAGSGRDPAAVYATTGGNPFFVAESLAAAPDTLPANIVEAVLARYQKLSASCRSALDQLCVIPSAIPVDLVAALPAGPGRCRGGWPPPGPAGNHGVTAVGGTLGMGRCMNGEVGLVGAVSRK